MSLDSARLGMTFENALTGEPLPVDAEVAASSIVVRVGDSVYAVHGRALTIEQTALLASQLTRVGELR